MMNRTLFILVLLPIFILIPGKHAVAQDRDSALVQDGVYNRPFIGSIGKTAVGGYVEGNTNSFVEDGVPEGFSFELRRFNIFLFSAISPHIRLISELEFEHGTEEIALETALMDLEINPSLKLRGGILLPPIGAFNVNHDSPNWEFVERPLVSTEIIPSTLSEVGFGLHGKFYPGEVTISYDTYLTNGLGDGIILNETGRTRLASGKREEQFEEDNNGSPALSGRISASHSRWGELGVSYYGGIYNTYRVEGEKVDEKRHVRLFAIDWTTSLATAEIKGEFAYALVDVPGNLSNSVGDRQWGAHLDVILPVWKPTFLSYEHSVVNVNLRLERVDYNIGSFESTGERIFDEVNAIVPGISFRPSPGTVFRLNYVRRWHRNLVGNDAVKTAGVQFGLATYF